MLLLGTGFVADTLASRLVANRANASKEILNLKQGALILGAGMLATFVTSYFENQNSMKVADLQSQMREVELILSAKKAHIEKLQAILESEL